MKRFIVPLLLLAGVMLQGPLAAAGPKVEARHASPDAEEISAVFAEIEGHYKDWPHYSAAAENLEGGFSTTQEAWVSDDQAPLARVVVGSSDDHGESMVQSFLKNGRLLFQLEQKQTTPVRPNAPTHVTEMRYYYADGSLARALAKEGTFQAKVKIDTAGIKNVPVPLDKVGDAETRYGTELKAVLKLIARLKLAAEEPGDSSAVVVPPAGGMVTGWRPIAGSASNNGAYVLAWGVMGQASPKGEVDEEGRMSVRFDEPNLINMVADVKTGKVLGVTKAKHFGDKVSYNHTECLAAWSADDRFVAQVSQAKWGSSDAYVYEVKEGKTLSLGADLLLAAINAAHAKLKGGRQIEASVWERLGFGLDKVEFLPSKGTPRLKIEMNAEIPKSGDGDGFDATIVLKVLAAQEGGAPVLTLESAEVR